MSMRIDELRRTVASEWTKLWTVRSTWWCLAGATALAIGCSLILGASSATNLLNEGSTARFPAGQSVISATSFVQFALVSLAMLVITSEYASGGMRITLQATPSRGLLLAAKALVLAPVMFATGVLSGAAAAAFEYLVLSGDTFGGYVTLPPAQTAVDLLRVGGFFALVSVLTLGVGAAMRSAAGTLTVVFMLLMGLPLLLLMTGSQPALEVSMRMPLFAGLAFMGSIDNLTGGPIPYSSGEGVVWLLGWTGAAVAAGYIVLRRRDA